MCAPKNRRTNTLLRTRPRSLRLNTTCAYTLHLSLGRQCTQYNPRAARCQLPSCRRPSASLRGPPHSAGFSPWLSFLPFTCAVSKSGCSYRGVGEMGLGRVLSKAGKVGRVCIFFSVVKSHEARVFVVKTSCRLCRIVLFVLLALSFSFCVFSRVRVESWS